jgi:hypothetical protein
VRRDRHKLAASFVVTVAMLPGRKKTSDGIDGFVYRDGIGACHNVAAMECMTGACELPEGEIVPCT